MDGNRWKALPLPALAKGGSMAKIIEFYIPVTFKKRATRWIPPEQKGKVLEFAAPQKRSA